MSVQVDLQPAVDFQGLPDQTRFARWATAAAANRVEDSELSVRIVSEQESAALNQKFRNRPGPTNVLAFPAALPEELGMSVLGDLAICRDVVEREAAEQGKETEAHWAHMVVHGTLHLLGYDHDSDEQASEMEALEAEVLRHLGYPDPYAPADVLENEKPASNMGAD